MSDAAIKRAVVAELEYDPGLDSTHIGVFVHDGVVTLTGFVDDFVQRHAAEEAVRRVRGVRAVAQELEVRLPQDKKLADDEIAARAARILAWDLRLPADAVAVTVESGVVQLTGEVAWEFQRREAEADVRKLGGVRRVMNAIAVRPAADTAAVQDSIRAAFERAADLEADGVSVQLQADGSVVLAGRVHTLRERAAAEDAAWSAPGVGRVINRIEIGG